MARTFTGLKLQGSIGKFGNEELSDVSGYTQLPDGKVGIARTTPENPLEIAAIHWKCHM